MLPMLAALSLIVAGPVSSHVSDAAPLNDPMRPICQITKDSFTVQYFSEFACPTKLELRRGDTPRAAYGHKPDGKVTIVEGSAAPSREHRLLVRGLEAGKRYYYRIWDPQSHPTAQEIRWGAGDGFRREFAVSTEAPRGWKTIIHIPVKVLLMPNVINVESATDDPDNPAPHPERITPEQIAKIESEYAVSSRYFWVNSGMRLWVDYHFFVDDRWERWGPEPDKVDAFYKGWPVCRSYAGKDFADPGGGDFTIVDTKDPLHVTKDPVVEQTPYSGQIEMAWPRRWNFRSRKWEFYNSGGGTLGLDDFPSGIPGRSQFLAGGDTAWLATHEFHHDLESHGEFSLSNREDDRIVFNHPAPRHRYLKQDGTVDEVTWTTSARHGEHWDVMAYWDRTLTDAQWLRLMFGETLVVRDADEDGFPDSDLRLPLDEKRFGSNPRTPRTDGEIGDLDKVMLSSWAPGPLQSSWTKPPFQGLMPNPKSPDSDGDGIPDALDPYPLVPTEPFIPSMHAAIDGDMREWAEAPVALEFDKGGIHFQFKQGHDEAGYYGFYRLTGPWQRVDAVFDGEGRGVYSGAGVLGFQTLRANLDAGAAGPEGVLINTKPLFGGSPGLRIKAAKAPDGSMEIEFSLPNRGLGPWYWTRGGNEIGAEMNVWDNRGRGYSAYEAYRPFYARMVEPYGIEPTPSGAPAELEAGAEVLPGQPALKAGPGWTLKDGAYSYSGDAESPLTIAGLDAHDFDFAVEIEANNDALLGAYPKATKTPSATDGYVGFAGGYGNTVSKLRLSGQEYGDDARLTPGRHWVQLSRREGEVWLLLDGKPVAWASDPNPRVALDRFAVIGGYGGHQIVHSIRYRLYE